MKDIILESLGKEKGINTVVLFGSYAKNMPRKQSDVDIALLYQKELVPNSMILVELRERLSEKLKREVDIICLNTASPIIAMQVVKHGKILLNKNPRLYENYLVNLFTDYADLKLMRKPLEENILKRKYYG